MSKMSSTIGTLALACILESRYSLAVLLCKSLHFHLLYGDNLGDNNRISSIFAAHQAPYFMDF